MRPAVFQADAAQRGAQIGIPEGGTFAGQIGQTDYPCRTGIDFCNLAEHRLEVLVWVELLLCPLRGQPAVIDRTADQPARSVLLAVPRFALSIILHITPGTRQGIEHW